MRTSIRQQDIGNSYQYLLAFRDVFFIGVFVGAHTKSWRSRRLLFRVCDGIFCQKRLEKETNGMLETIAILLLVLWVLGLVSSTTVGGFIHILLVLAIVVILIRVIQGRRI